jgi:hypothetical protein
VDPVSPLSVNVVIPPVVPICAKEVQLAPAQRSMSYPVTPTLSVEAIQLKPICELEVAVAVRLPGAEGACVSPTPVVVAYEMFEYTLRLPAASVALTRYP